MDSTTLQAATGCTLDNAQKYADALSATFDEFSISTVTRQAMFLGQIAYESELFNAVVEDLNYSAQGLLATWPDKFDAASAPTYANQPQRIANVVYAGVNGNGDEASGDGWLFRGRGFIQITGRANYLAAEQALCVPAVDNPDVLATVNGAAQSAGWFWYAHGLNQLADKQLFSSITTRINGGLNGLAARTALYQRALGVLKNVTTG